ncbi:MAG: hypothetical protein J6K88_01110 [Oscillospiraceae bacterium]|nr:hypothetical protein [Oscillospiraceae bacterium]
MRALGIILGAAAIVLSGFSLRDSLKKRVRLLEKLQRETESFKKAVLIYKKPIGEIIRELTLPPFSENYRSSPKDEPAFLIVSECIYLIKQCGASDEGALISDAIRKIREIKTQAEKELSEKGAMYIKLSICLSLLFIVIVI